jgi:LuxR family transcriptional regulator, maltose regulon positive regulatory protein
MPELPTTGVTRDAAMPRDVLVATKFHMPPAGTVRRPRLLTRLAAAIDRGLTLVCTPAGFGKTTLLGDWARRSRRTTAWLSVDAGDNDPARFWRYVGAALDQPQPGVADQVDVLLGGSGPALEAVATVVVNHFAGVPSEQAVTLVLDDYHLIEDPAVHAGVGFLVDHLPPGLRLILATRADPPLPLALLRARGQLSELREHDLRFTRDETAVFLREVAGMELPLDSLAALHERTEGWAAGLQLAALSLQGRPDPAGFVRTFAGSHRYVLDYLTQEVLARQTDDLVGFLLDTSILERLSGPLCDAVTGRSDSQALLERIERANLFLRPLDEVRGWWRYHHLFADLLRARLQQTRPERVPDLHRAAAGWHESKGSADDAVSHALAAGEVGWAARLVERHVEELLRRSEGVTLARWLAALPPASVASRARLCLAQAVRAVVGGQVEAIEPLLAAAEEALAATGEELHEPSVGRAVSVLANVPASIAFLRAESARLRGDPEDALAFDLQARAHLGEQDWLLGSMVRWNLGVADWMRGRLGEAESLLTEVLAERRAAGEGFLSILIADDVGRVQRARGHLGVALATYQRALDDAGAAGRGLPHAGMAHVGVAEVLYERDDLVSASDHATRGVALCRQLAYTQPLATGLGMLARIRQAEGNTAGALEAITLAEQVRLSPQVTALLNPVPVWRVGLLLATGDVAQATQWIQDRGLHVTDEPSYPREPEFLVLARVLLATGRSDRAVELLDSLYALAAAQGRTGSIVQVRALQALALAARGNQTAALTALAEALALAGPEGYVRVFADETAGMARLLGRLTAAERTGQVTLARVVPPGYLDRLAQALRPGRARPAPRKSDDADDAGQTIEPAPLVEPLTRRELQVLELMAVGRSNQQIADELVIVLDTVKKHVGHILDKLAAANRTQAVARARALGLVR